MRWIRNKSWRRHVPDVFRCTEARSLANSPNIVAIFGLSMFRSNPEVGLVICKRMELWWSKMSSARKRFRSAGVAAFVWVSILCQWNYCIIFHLIQCFVFDSDLNWLVCLHTSFQLLVKPSFGFPPFRRSSRICCGNGLKADGGGPGITTMMIHDGLIGRQRNRK